MVQDSSDRIRELLQTTLVKEIAGAIRVPRVSLHFLGLNRESNRLHWIAVDQAKQDILDSALAATEGLSLHNNPLELPTDHGGLTSKAYREKCFFYSNDARIDRLSRYSTIDRQIGIHSALYIPIGQEHHSGVLLATLENPGELPRLDYDGALVQMSRLRQRIQDTLESIPTTVEEREIRNRSIASCFQERLESVRIASRLAVFYAVLFDLFDLHLANYNEYISYFDVAVVDAHARIDGGNQCFRVLNDGFFNKLKAVQKQPHDLIWRCLTKYSPVGQLANDLFLFEPILSSIGGYRRHFEHMFHVMSLGNVLLSNRVFKRVFVEQIQRELEQMKEMYAGFPHEVLFEDREYRKLHQEHYINGFDDLQGQVAEPSTFVEELWFVISTTHDIAYPIEKTESWLEGLFERYLPGINAKTVFDKSQVLVHSNCLRNLQIMADLFDMRMQVPTKLRFSYAKTLVSDLMITNLIETADHAVLSAMVVAEFLTAFAEKAGEVDGRGSHYDALRQTDFYQVLPGLLQCYYPPLIALIGLPIALHNYHKWAARLQKAQGALHEGTENAGSNEMKARLLAVINHRLSFDHFPLDFLLAFCDTLQESDRDPGRRPKVLSVERIEVDDVNRHITISLGSELLVDYPHLTTRVNKIMQELEVDQRDLHEEDQRDGALKATIQKYREVRQFKNYFGGGTWKFTVQFADLRGTDQYEIQI